MREGLGLRLRQIKVCSSFIHTRVITNLYVRYFVQIILLQNTFFEWHETERNSFDLEVHRLFKSHAGNSLHKRFEKYKHCKYIRLDWYLQITKIYLSISGYMTHISGKPFKQKTFEESTHTLVYTHCTCL